jgi:hypothetical protein
VQIWRQSCADILQCLCDACKILVAIMEQKWAVKLHDARTGAANIVMDLRDSFTMCALLSFDVCTTELQSYNSIAIALR